MQLNQSDREEPFAESDHVDRVREQWRQQWPELDTGPLGVVGRVGRLREFFDRRLEEFFGAYGLTRQAWDVLAACRRAGRPYELTPSALSAALMRTSGAVTHTLQRLEYAGLVTRVPSATDQRSLLVRLTPAGKRLVDKVAPKHLENERKLLSTLDESEQEALANLLKRLLFALENPSR
ncbi:MarR family winged helix-turn-helix transcriptional regulator [Fodinicola acaciae]|uniref:MarR family winged helix-turn-helix transcriptional regulator n=1 Tax=Fodinicola acaciae TaxID=2681555 RepID=UPI0013D301BA|nr:MarR family transcriptional regulator [Fodinicola acaciae]